jgi:hypothetical protein
MGICFKQSCVLQLDPEAEIETKIASAVSGIQ